MLRFRRINPDRNTKIDNKAFLVWVGRLFVARDHPLSAWPAVRIFKQSAFALGRLLQVGGMGARFDNTAFATSQQRPAGVHLPDPKIWRDAVEHAAVGRF